MFFPKLFVLLCFEKLRAFHHGEKLERDFNSLGVILQIIFHHGEQNAGNGQLRFVIQNLTQ
jgi:hypothetical protein